MPVRFKVWGREAVFTRPEFKAERVSYDTITPSAARGICDSIFWHPGIRWNIDAITVCKPIRFGSITKNEIDTITTERSVIAALNGSDVDLSIYAEKARMRRTTVFLKDVEYVIDASFEMTDEASPTDNPGKFLSIMNRRIKKGQNYYTPYLGTMDCQAFIEPCKKAPECPEELKGEIDLGIMFYGNDYSNPENVKPMFFHAVMKNGVLLIPKWGSKEILR